MKAHLEFKDNLTEENYKKYSFKRRQGVLQMQRGAVGLFSFLGIFHLIYLYPKKEEFSNITDSFIVVASVGLLIAILLGFCPKIRHNDWVIFITNLLINFVLIEPNFLVIAETRNLSSFKYFWLGFRISSINLITLLCYNSFIYKILQINVTIVFLMIRMSKEASLHNLLVDSSLGFLICYFFYYQEKGERMTYNQLHDILLQKQSWKNFLNFLPEGIAIFSGDYNCIFMNESVKNIFKLAEIEDVKTAIFNLSRMNTEYSDLKDSKSFPGAGRFKDHFHTFYAKSRAKRETIIGKLHLGNSKKKNKDHRNSALNADTAINYNEVFFTEFESKYLSLKLTHIDFDNMDSILVLISDVSESIKSHILEENKKYRDLLFASFSHEIRTPLNCILLLLGKIIRGGCKISDKILRKYILPSFYSGQILLHLVNDILDYSFLMRDELKLNISEIDIKAECLEIMEVISMQAQSKGIKLLLKLANNLPRTIISDGSRFKQILCHLLLNALKFTYEGQITVKVLRSMEYENGLTITVKDTGIGMTEEAQRRLREKLRLTSLSSFKVTENAAGASLRTLLSQSLALMMGFHEDIGIRFFSKPKEGSKFRFIIQNHQKDIFTHSRKRSRSESQNNGLKMEEKLPSGILIKWISTYEKLSLNDRYDINILNSDSKPKSPSSKLQRESYGDLAFIEENMKTVDIEEESEESMVSEHNENLKTIPDFEDIMFLKQRSRKKKELSLRNKKAYKSLTCIYQSEVISQCTHSEILVVDDDEFNILAVKTILKQKSLFISSARNGAQAIELLHKETSERRNCCTKFLLILMDVNMPVMGGLEATRLIKQDMKDNKLPWMPIVGCTAFVGSNDEIICRDNGMDDYETKPLNEKKITRLLQKWALKSVSPSNF